MNSVWGIVIVVVLTAANKLFLGDFSDGYK